MTTDEQQDAIRTKVRVDDEKAKAHLGVYFLGKHCPLLKDECRGPECPWFLMNGEEQNGRRVITSGNCCIPLLASQAGPIADGLVQLALIAATPKAPGQTVIPTSR